MPNLNEMFDSKYLKSSDFPEPKVGTVQGFKKVNMAREGQEPQYKWICKFKEWDKPMAMNKTNLKRMAKAFDSENTDNWIGKPIEIYYDEDVEMGGEVVGGLRVRKAPARKKPLDPEKVNALAADASVQDMDDDIPF